MLFPRHEPTTKYGVLELLLISRTATDYMQVKAPVVQYSTRSSGNPALEPLEDIRWQNWVGFLFRSSFEPVVPVSKESLLFSHSRPYLRLK